MKVGVVGAGLVGSTAAYAMVMSGVGREIVMVDVSPERAQAQADDISHAVPFAHPLDIYAGDYKSLAGSHAVVIAAGVNRQPGETRIQLLQRNAAIFREVVPQVLEHASDAVLVIATNPVDVTTHLTAHFAALGGVPSTPDHRLGHDTRHGTVPRAAQRPSRRRCTARARLRAGRARRLAGADLVGRHRGRRAPVRVLRDARDADQRGAAGRHRQTGAVRGQVDHCGERCDVLRHRQCARRVL